MPIARYTCTQPSQSGTTTDGGQCNVTNGLRTCETKEGVRPNLLNDDLTGAIGVYVWHANTNPFVVLDIPRGWCVGSVKMTFLVSGSIPTVRLSVHGAQRLSNNTDRTMFSIARKDRIQGTTRVLMSLTALACGRYLRINMASAQIILLTEIEVLDTSKCTHRHQEPA